LSEQAGFSFLSEATDVQMKTNDLANGQGGYLQAGNSTILTAFQPMICIANLLIMKILKEHTSRHT
jgi:hypothetical protein